MFREGEQYSVSEVTDSGVGTAEYNDEMDDDEF